LPISIPNQAVLYLFIVRDSISPSFER
jgi:hypothetical protein